MTTAKSKSLASLLKAWLKLVRIEHAFMSMAAVAIGVLLAGRQTYLAPGGFIYLPEWPSLPALLPILAVPFLINIGAFALNDYWDIEADRKNKRMERPLVSGALSPSTAVWTAAAGLLFGSLYGMLISPEAGAIAIFFALFSIAYDRFLKDWPVAGNLFIAVSMAIAFLFGSVAIGIPIALTSPAILLLCAGAACAGFGRELVKTVQDMEGDKAARGSNSLPHVIGARKSLLLAALAFLLYAASIPLLVLSSTSITWNVLSLGLLALSGLSYLALTIELLAKTPKENQLERIRKSTLYALGLALLAVALAALI